MDAKGPGLLFIVGRGASVASRGHGGGNGGRRVVVVVVSVTAMSDEEINIIILFICLTVYFVLTI